MTFSPSLLSGGDDKMTGREQNVNRLQSGTSDLTNVDWHFSPDCGLYATDQEKLVSHN